LLLDNFLCDGEHFPFDVVARYNANDSALFHATTTAESEQNDEKEGGNRDHHREARADRSELAQALRLAWLPKVAEGFFMRAESFYNFAAYIDQVSDLRAYGGKSLLQQSHGESFLALFANRFEQGLYILDEPEAALSPQRQLTVIAISFAVFFGIVTWSARRLLHCASAVLAHPGLNRTDQAIPGIVEAGLDGIECFHTKHSTATTEHYLALADRFQLLVTGGSDCHGLSKGKPLIGTVKLPHSYIEALQDRVRRRAAAGPPGGLSPTGA